MSILGRVPPFRRSFEEVVEYAVAWERHNRLALSATGPIWVVLGDSAAQGVGASAHDRGWVGQVHERALPDHRLVNLSRSGARTREVVDLQLAAARRLQPAVVTAVIGGNDAVHTPLPQWLRDIDDLATALPAGAVVSTVSRGVLEHKTRRANEHVRIRAAEHGLRVADVWAHTGPPYKGLYADGFHPNDLGYRAWADAVVDALALG